MYSITFSINIQVCGQFIYELCYFHSLEISINLLWLRMYFVMSTELNVKRLWYNASFQSSDKANLKAKLMNA